MTGKYSPCHIPVAKMSGRNDDSATCLQGWLHMTLPAFSPITQIAYIPLDETDIKVRKAHKVGGVAAIVTPRGKGQAPYMRITHRTPCNLGHIQLRHQTFGRPAQVATRADRETQDMSCDSRCPPGQGVAASRKIIDRRHSILRIVHVYD
jgi:hypothetical protein